MLNKKCWKWTEEGNDKNSVTWLNTATWQDIKSVEVKIHVTEHRNMIPLNVHQVIDKKFKNIKVTMAHISDIKKIIIKKTCRTHLIGSTTWVAV